MTQPVNVLLIHDTHTCHEPIQDLFRKIKARPFQVIVASSLDDGLKHLANMDIGVTLIEGRFLKNQEAEVIAQIQSCCPQTGIVLLLENDEETQSFEGLATREYDYLVKNDLTPRLLELTLCYAMERKQTQKTLWAAEKRLEFLIESIKDFAIFAMDLEGRIDFWNSGAQQVFGYHEDEILGQLFDILFTEEDRANNVPDTELKTAAEKGLALDERWHLKKNQQRFYVSGTTRPLFDALKNLIGFTKVAHDLTERELAREVRDSLLHQALASRLDLEKANGIKEEFLALISHEMRTPLASIVGFASMMTSKTMVWPRETMVEYAQIIEAEAQRMSSLIEQLMDHSRQQTGTLTIDFEMTSLENILHSVRPQLQVLTENHHLSIDLAPHLPPIYADPQRIAQVLTNLVSNAARYSPAQTPVTVHAHREGSEIQVDVIDQGRGIPPEQREKVFEAFHQVSRSGTKGLGLGLALCKNLVERHKGRIWVQEHEGQGTILSFTLPTAGPETA